jgi:WD40 repeat protein
MDIVTACAFVPEGDRIISSSVDQTLLLWSTASGRVINKWSGNRVTDIAVNPSGNMFYAVSQERKIKTIDLRTYQEISTVTMMDSITSLCLSRDGRYALISLANQEIQIWDFNRKRQLQKFQGHIQTKYVLRSCFGGADQNFVMSGSEDGNIYIWHRKTNALFLTLPGHQKTVNAVSWSPNPDPMFASASDDGTIRIWADDVCDTEW